jgi:hypothetical protein
MNASHDEMWSTFADSSALVKLCADETGHRAAEAILSWPSFVTADRLAHAVDLP